MRKEDLSTDTSFDPCWFSLDYTFKQSKDNISTSELNFVWHMNILYSVGNFY